MNSSRARLRFVGISCVVFAVVGLLSSSLALAWFLGYAQQNSQLPRDLKLAGISEALVCAVVHLTLLVLGLNFFRMKIRVYPAFMALLAFEAIYLISILILSHFSAGTGNGIAQVDAERTLAGSVLLLANGGLLLQVITLFPLWGPFLISRTDKRLP